MKNKPDPEIKDGIKPDFCPCHCHMGGNHKDCRQHPVLTCEHCALGVQDEGDINQRIMKIRESWGEDSEYCQDEIIEAIQGEVKREVEIAYEKGYESAKQQQDQKITILMQDVEKAEREAYKKGYIEGVRSGK